MRADRKQEDCLGVAMLHELEYDAKVVTGAGRPIARQITFEFVCSQARSENVFPKPIEGLTDRFRRNGLLLGKALRRANERRRLNQDAFHDSISRMISSTLAGLAVPLPN